MLRRPHGRAYVNPDSPRAFAVCDRCGALTNLYRLSPQAQWNGPVLQNLRILVCEDCLDIPAPFLRQYTLPPDPRSIPNARPEPYMLDEVDNLGSNETTYFVTGDEGAAIATNEASQDYQDVPPDPNT